MTRTPIATLKGPQGNRGPQGLPGADGIPTDAAVAQLVGIPSATKTALDVGYMRVGTIVVNVKDLGAKGDGATDDTTAIQAALNAGDVIFFPAGTYIVSAELKVPSYTAVTGAGMDVSIIRMKGGTDRALNVFTNASNTRAARFNYDEKIRFADLTVDGNYTGRVTTSVPWEGNGCGIMLAAVRDSVIERVKVTDAPLHCFAVDASWLPTETTGGADFYAESPSYNITIRDCIGINPGVDDCFTTHYSHDITIVNCYAAIGTINPTSGGIQNGFEVDDGSWRVTVRDCYTKGAQNGVQVKGHTYAPPAYDVTIDNVTAEGCACGFAAVSTGAVAGTNVRFLNCTVESPDMNIGSEGNRGSTMKVYGYRGVTIRELTVRNAVYGGIIVWTAGDILIDGVHGENAFTASPLGAVDGFIRITGETVSTATITVQNVTMKGAIGIGSVIRQNDGEAFQLRVRGVTATAGGSGLALVSDSYLTPYRHYADLNGVGFSKQLAIRGGAGATSDLEFYGPVSRGAGNPEGVVFGWPGWLFMSTSGSWYRKASGAAATGWVASA